MRPSTQLLSLLLALALLGPAVAAPASAQSSTSWVPEAARGQEFELSIRSIMRGEENVGVAPSQIRWTDDGQWVYFTWRPGGLAWDEESSLYRVRADGSDLEKLDETQAREVEPLIAAGDLSVDRHWRIASVEGDLYLVDRASMAVRRLTHTGDSEGSPLFTADGAGVIFQRGDNLYRLTLADGTLQQLTWVADGQKPDEDKDAEGQRGILEAQQRELFEHVRREKAKEDEDKTEREAREAEEPKPLYLDKGERLQGMRSTREGAFVLVRAGKQADDAKRTVIPDWITEDGYTRDIDGRTKVGDVQGASRLGLLRTATGEITWLELTPPEVESATEEAAATDETAEQDEKPKLKAPDSSPSVFNFGWNDAGTRAFAFVVSSDNKDRWLWSIDAETGERTLLDSLHDEAWVNGPCFAFCVGFLPERDTLYFVSEETGYAHLYAIEADGTGKRALTAGEWEVLGVQVPESRDAFLLSTNEGSPFNEHAWRMGFDGSDKRALTHGAGRYQTTFAPDGGRVAVLHDVANRPTELFLANGVDPISMTAVTDSPTAAWRSFPWLEPEIVRFAAEDGTHVPARIYRPADMGAQANGAGVIFVHGAGYLHNVHDYWSSYYREYQFHHFLAAAGYTVLDIDYRGSAGYGRDWRTGIYRWMGGKDLSDQVDGARYLVASEGVDAKRVGLYGGSYGGFITLMGLFTAPDTFKSGAALRSVTDWSHYNHGYTGRILNLPQDDEEAYEKSSPIFFAENFRDDQYLVMLHGMVDVNVHVSDVVRLTQRLIELGKTNWELAVYPVEDHGFVEPASWIDEYRRIFEMFERTLREPGCTNDGALCAIRLGSE